MFRKRRYKASRILILGGYGNTGSCISRLLLAQTPDSVSVVLAGRHMDRAEHLATILNKTYPGQRVQSRYADASNEDGSLEEALKDKDVVIVASSTSQYARQAAIQAGVDYFDIQFSREKVTCLKSMKTDIQRAGSCFITDGGFYPGLPAALIHYVAPKFERIKSAIVGSVIQVDWKAIDYPTFDSMEEFVNEFANIEMLEFKEGAWRNTVLKSMVNPRTMDFGPPFGKRPVVPMFLGRDAGGS